MTFRDIGKKIDIIQICCSYKMTVKNKTDGGKKSESREIEKIKKDLESFSEETP